MLPPLRWRLGVGLWWTPVGGCRSICGCLCVLSFVWQASQRGEPSQHTLQATFLRSRLPTCARSRLAQLL